MIRFDTKKDMDHYDNLYHQIYEKDKKIKQLKEKIDILLEDNNQLEEIRIKAIECIKICGININTPDEDIVIRKVLKNILEILGDKENE